MAAIGDIFTDALKPFAEDDRRIFETNSPKWVADVERMLTVRNEKEAAASLSDVKDQLGVGRSSIYREIAAGRLRTCKLGSRTLIHKTDFDDYCASPANSGGGPLCSAAL